MSRTHRRQSPVHHGFPASYDFPHVRPEHQEERGERYGNNRKMFARMKWQERKSRRAKDKYDWMDEFE